MAPNNHPSFMRAPEALQFAPVFDNALVRDRVPSLLLVDRDGDGSPDERQWDFNGDGRIDGVQCLATLRSVLTLSGAPRWRVPRVVVRLIGETPVLSVTFVHAQLTDSSFEINALPRPVFGQGGELVSVCQFWPATRELDVEACQMREAFRQYDPAARVMEAL